MGRFKIKKKGKKRRASFWKKNEKKVGRVKINKKEGLLFFKISKYSNWSADELLHLTVLMSDVATAIWSNRFANRFDFFD